MVYKVKIKCITGLDYYFYNLIFEKITDIYEYIKQINENASTGTRFELLLY